MKRQKVDYHGFRLSRINEPRFRHLWLLVPIPLALVLPAMPWYSLLVLAVGVSALLDPANRTLADRAARTVVIQRGQGCALPG